MKVWKLDQEKSDFEMSIGRHSILVNAAEASPFLTYKRIRLTVAKT